MAPIYTISGSMNASLGLTQQQSLTDATTQDGITIGTGKLPKANRTWPATTPGQFPRLYHALRTGGAGANDDIILNGAGAPNGAFGRPLAFTNILFAYLGLQTPAAGVKLVLGNHPNAPWQAWFSTNTFTEDVRVFILKPNDIDGWAVGAPLAAPQPPPTGSKADS